eukprot:2122749-Rhodomonas_salina.2
MGSPSLKLPPAWHTCAAPPPRPSGFRRCRGSTETGSARRKGSVHDVAGVIHHPGTPDDGEQERADAESHHVHVVAEALLQLVLPGVDQAHGDVLVKVHDDEAKQAANHCEADALAVDVSQVHEPRAHVGAEGGGADAV